MTKEQFELSYLAAFSNRRTVWQAAFAMSDLNGIKPHDSLLYRKVKLFIKEHWLALVESPPLSPKRAKYYMLTDAGREHLRIYLDEQLSPLRVIEKLLSEE